MARDLIGDLWDASFKGVPFFIEKDDEDGGRRIVVHEFPNRDDPFNEDLGRHAKRFSVEGYVVGDDYVSASSAIMAACDAAGAGTLVLPTFGPVNARCLKVKRARSKDRIGYIGLQFEFVREGVSTPVVVVDYLAQIALDAIDAMAAQVAALVAQMSVKAQPSWIADATIAGLQDIPATLDLIRGESQVDGTLSLGVGSDLAALYNAIPAAVSPVSGVDASIVPTFFATARSLGAAIAPNTAASIFADAVDMVAQPVALPTSTNAATAAANAALVARLARLAMLSAYLEAVINATYASRPDGVTARASLVGRFDRELALCTGAANVDLYVALQDLRNAGVDYLSQLIATLAPVLTVRTNISLPSLALAWSLYADPLRAPELVARNGVRHPSYMPTQFEALAAS